MNDSLSVRARTIHAEALAAVREYKRCEVRLIEVLQQADDHRIYGSLGYNSLFRYASDGLGLSEEVAYVFINVARKARQVPALKEEISRGTISITKAKKISPVLNSENQKHWLDLARNASKAKLEKEVARAAPSTAIVERMKYVPAGADVESARILKHVPRVQLEVGVSEALMLKIRRAQEVLSQKRRGSMSLEAVLDQAISLYLEKEDPMRRAGRQRIRGRLAEKLRAESSTPRNKKALRDHSAAEQFQPSQLVPGPVAGRAKFSGRRTPLPAATKHKVMLKFGGCCSFEKDGERCTERKFLEIHHLRPLSLGGSNDLGNLRLLCAGHHRAQHLSGP